MLTFQDLYERFTKITSDDSADNITFGKSLINETYKHICGSRKWWFMEKTFTSTTTASQTTIKLPVDFRKLETFNITSNDVKYTPIREVADPVTWDRLNRQGSNITSTYPVYYIIRDGKIEVYPAIADSGLTITIEYLAQAKDMTADDYTTGTIDAVANGSTTVTGSGTSWTSAMAGRYLQITSDGYWYKIASVTNSTTLELDIPYEGTTLTSPAGEAYRIGECPLIPEAYQSLLWYKPVSVYYQMKGDERRARYYSSGEMRAPGLYESVLRDMIRELGSQTTQNVQTDDVRIINVNDYPQDLT